MLEKRASVYGGIFSAVALVTKSVYCLRHVRPFVCLSVRMSKFTGAASTVRFSLQFCIGDCYENL